jgi:hypothetical protein
MALACRLQRRHVSFSAGLADAIRAIATRAAGFKPLK